MQLREAYESLAFAIFDGRRCREVWISRHVNLGLNDFNGSLARELYYGGGSDTTEPLREIGARLT